MPGPSMNILKTNKGTSTRKKVLLGLSGGVDSAVSAKLLLDRGYEVTGAFIKVWSPEFLPCTWREERRDAMRVAAKLKIPFLFFDFEDEYKKGVVDYMVYEYKNGRTPNPDVMCNREVKFGALWREAQKLGFNYIATGHYAGIKAGVLIEGKDTEKDQSYFLWTLEKDDLAHTLFPLESFTKKEVRKIALEIDLPVSTKKDSQGICFIGNVSLEEFLKELLTTSDGDVVDTEGNKVGIHKGAILYTMGERHGLRIVSKTSTEDPYYVVSKDLSKNTVTVSNKVEEILSLSPTKISISNVNLIDTKEGEDLTARIRYRGTKVPIELRYENGGYVVDFTTPQRGLSLGQSIVFYKDEMCVGGGIMNEVLI